MLKGLKETKADFKLYYNEPLLLCLCFLTMFLSYKTQKLPFLFNISIRTINYIPLKLIRIREKNLE